MNFARTAVVEGRFDIRTLAALARYLRARGYPVSNKSQLLGFIAEVFQSALKDAGVITPVESTKEAMEILNRLGLSLGQRNLNVKALNDQLQSEGLNVNLPPSAFSDPTSVERALELMGSPEARGYTRQLDQNPSIETAQIEQETQPKEDRHERSGSGPDGNGTGDGGAGSSGNQSEHREGFGPEVEGQ